MFKNLQPFVLLFCLSIAFAPHVSHGLDTDGDGVVDELDNCTLVPNAGVLACDTDLDGYGNACDGDFDNDWSVQASGDFMELFLPAFKEGGDPSGQGMDMDCSGAVDASPDFSPNFLAQFGAGAPGPSGFACAGTVPCTVALGGDSDGDGVPSLEDVCPAVADPLQEDLDHDGFGDACDLDADGDGFADAAEIARKLDPRERDTDGDGARDGFDPHPLDPERAVDPDAILLKSRAFVPANGLDPTLVDNAVTTALVQLNESPRPESRQDLESLYGLVLHHYVPNRSWVARVDPARLADAAADERVRAILPFEAADRIDPDLLHHGLPPIMQSSDGRLPLAVTFVAGTERADAEAILLGAGGTGVVGDPQRPEFEAEFPAGALQLLASHEEVLFLELTRHPGEGASQLSRSDLNVDSPSPVTPLVPETGAGQLVAVIEASAVAAGSGMDPGPCVLDTHFDLTPRVSHGHPVGVSDYSDHATAVASVVAGAGTCSVGAPDDTTGIAPGASIGSFHFTNDMEAVRSRYLEITSAPHNASVANNSWTNPVNSTGGYGVIARNLDRVIQGDHWGFPLRPTVVFSAGNTRGAGFRCSIPGAVAGDGFDCVNRPATAKNVISVGAVIGTAATAALFSPPVFTQSPFSANGPTDDGRIKPELVAPGSAVVADWMPASVPGGCAAVAGTSFSAPQVSGLAALLLEGWGSRGISLLGSNPLPSTIRAILIHTARDLDNAGTVGLTATTDGPSFRTGWGIPDAQVAMGLLDSHLTETRIFESAELDATGDVQVFEFTLQPTDVGSALDITLAWDDVASPAPGGASLVNDLDLEVEAPNGFVYHPWKLASLTPTLPPTCTVDTGASSCDPLGTAFGGTCTDMACPVPPGTIPEDRVNTLERVRVPAVQPGQAGIWRVRVTAAAMNEPSTPGGFDQRFSLILPVDNDVDCGSTLAGDAFLFEDLDCSGTPSSGPQIRTDDTTLDCNGFAIIGNGPASPWGVRAAGVTNAVVRDCRIFNFYDGIRAEPTSNPLVNFQALDNVLGDNANGIRMLDSEAGSVEGNLAYGSLIAGLNVSGRGNAVLDNELEVNALGIQVGENGVTSEFNHLFQNVVGVGHDNGLRIQNARATTLDQNGVCWTSQNALNLLLTSQDTLLGSNNVLCDSGGYDVWVAPTASDMDTIRNPGSLGNICSSVNTTAAGQQYSDLGVPAGCNTACLPAHCASGAPIDLGGSWIDLPGDGSNDSIDVDIDDFEGGASLDPEIVGPLGPGIIIWTLPDPRVIGRQLSVEELEGLDPASVQIYHRDEKGDSFTPVAGSGLAPNSKLVLGHVESPGRYAVFGKLE